MIQELALARSSRTLERYDPDDFAWMKMYPNGGADQNGMSFKVGQGMDHGSGV